MPVIPIADLDDPRLDAYRNLKATNATRNRTHFVAEGDKLVHRLLGAGFKVESLVLAEPLMGEFAPLVHSDTPIYTVTAKNIERLVGFNFHRGALACAPRPPNADLEAICYQRPYVTLVVCPEIHDPENLGAILRNSAIFGVDGLVLGSSCCDPFSRRVLRVSMGAAFQVPIAEVDDLTGVITRLGDTVGLKAWATVTDRDAEPFDQIARPPKLALLLGSEGHGLSESWCNISERRITVPMRTDFDSLNVAAAAGVLLYHLTR